MKWHSWSLGHSKYRIDNEFDEIEKNRIEEFFISNAIGIKISFFVI
jgi:hypothetical protein